MKNINYISIDIHEQAKLINRFQQKDRLFAYECIMWAMQNNGDMPSCDDLYLTEERYLKLITRMNPFIKTVDEVLKLSFIFEAIEKSVILVEKHKGGAKITNSLKNNNNKNAQREDSERSLDAKVKVKVKDKIKEDISLSNDNNISKKCKDFSENSYEPITAAESKEIVPSSTLFGEVRHENPQKLAKITKPKGFALQAEEFYPELRRAYPNRDGSDPKSDAIAALAKAFASGASEIEILHGVEGYKNSCQRNGTEGKFIKMLSTWLNKKSWQDDYAQPPPVFDFSKLSYAQKLSLDENYDPNFPSNFNPDPALLARIQGGW